MDRVYMALIGRGDKGLVLEHIDSTDMPVDIENLHYSDYKDEQDNLISKIEPIADKITKISITLPAESVIVTQLPADINQSNDTLRELLSLEIKQSYPHFNTEEFLANIIPMSKKKNAETAYVLGVIFTSEIVKNCTDLLKPLGKDISNIDFSQMNAHSAFSYNYPESKEKNCMILCIQDNFIDISVVKDGKPCYYNLLSYSDVSQIPELLEQQHAKIIEEVVDTVEGAYFYGISLTKDLYLQIWETCMLLGLETARLNAFRYVNTELDERRKEYASRVQHIFPPAVGGSFKPYHERIKFY
jgi:hypothetical protein